MFHLVPKARVWVPSHPLSSSAFLTFVRHAMTQPPLVLEPQLLSILLGSICLKAPAPGHHSRAWFPGFSRHWKSPGGLGDPHCVSFTPRVSGPAGVGWGPRSSISNKFPGDADPVGPQTHSEGH